MTPSAEQHPPSDPDSSRAPDESGEPTTVGTLFIMILFLMSLTGMWGIMYLTLLER